MEVRGELPGRGVLWQPRQGEYALGIVVKATFTLAPGEAKLATTQEPLVEGDTYWDGDAARSLLAASDLAPSKPLCDVVLVGHAYTPKGSASRQATVRLAFEDVDKSIEVRTDRSVGPDGTIYQGNRWTRMPLVYERAAGGHGTWNPVGVHPASRDMYGRTPLPNLMPPGRADDAARFPEPLGFGPIAPSWPARAERLGYHPLPTPALLAAQPLADGFDLGWFNVAPIDQQIASLPEDGHLLLENLHPLHPVLATSLPGIKPRVMAERRGGREPVAMRADTLWVDVDRGQLFVVWRGQLALDRPNEEGTIRVDVDRPRKSWQTVQQAIGRETLSEEATRPGTREHPAARSGARPRGEALPFSGRGAQGPKGTARGEVPKLDALPFQQNATRAMPAAVSVGLPFRAKNTDATANPSVPPEPHSAKLGEVTTSTSFASLAQVPASAAPPASWSAPQQSFQGPPAYAPPVFAPQPEPPPVPAPQFGAPPPAPAPVAGPAMLGAQPPPVMQHAGAAALGGLVTASNAAADPSVASARAGAVARRIEGDVLHLLWFSPEIAPRIHRKPEWKKILDALEKGPFDPEIDQPALSEDPSELEDRREVFEVLARGTSSSQDGVDRSLFDAVRADGRFAPQLLLLTGELRFDFDELEQLKANVSAATPFSENDEPLKKVLEQTTQFLGSPELVSSPDVSAAMSRRIQDAFAASNRPVSATYLDEQTERALLERRAYQKRAVFGEPHLRSLFYFAGSDTGVPTYLPESLGKKLPLFRRLRVRLLVEAHFQADQFESHPAALRAVAIARIVR